MVQRLRSANSAIWLVIIFLGGAGTLGLIVFDDPKGALLWAFASVCGWTLWYVYSRWLFGMKRHVTKFMRAPIDRLTFVDKQVGTNRLADIVRAMQKIQDANRENSMHAMAAGFELKSLRTTHPATEEILWRTVDIDGGNLVNIPANAVFLLAVDGKKCVVKATFESNGHDEDDHFSSQTINQLQLCAHSIEHANTLMRWLLKQSSESSIFRGQVLQVHQPAGKATKTTVRIVDRPTAQRDDVVLPESVLSLAETLMLGQAKHRERLARFGHSSRLGLLFYGPPGTGKTLVTKFLLSKLADHTVVVPTDLEPETLRESFRLAAYLEPTVVIIEDVDLLATNRTEAHGRLDALQELMNEMDGLSSNSNTTVILSTNRPDVLEPALASRPGRVSQAIEFPLPDQQARQDLLRLFLGGDRSDRTDSVQVDLAMWAERTEKASPAFLQELCRRAILLAGEEPSQSIAVTDESMREAIHQLVVTGGKLNTNVLGFPDATD